ncbi:metal-dependent transcriptional regulator [Actinoallomurus spadix]|uniref:Metal-dependent transcriptional regulator n=1 Tax=Actinoallomurus spadix TaxID=79912 RepID=A0ABN0XNB4_9ACTN|nr:metal-dependent transcriptional regulator [Actinoallomurus spadix]
MTAHGLIDTTEMYLRTIFELEEEGIVPLRARIAERLSQSGPTVSQTVARMERDGLLKVEGDRHLELTDTGRSLAVRVMRKHRLAECLLVNVIGLPWEDVHVEACRWEHVMSEEVERRLVTLLDGPSTCPHGNPIPGLAELGADVEAWADPRTAEPLALMTEVATATGVPVVVQRISEQVQGDRALMLRLKEIGIQPGREVTLAAADEGIRVTCDDAADSRSTEIPHRVAAHVFVSKR